MYKALVAVGMTAGVAGAVLLSGSALAANNNQNGNGYGYTRQLDAKAQSLGMTADQLREQLKTRTLYQIAQDKGVSIDKLHADMLAQAKQRWQAAGLSADQIEEREQAMQERQANCDGSGAGQGQRQGRMQGFHGGARAS